MKVEKQIKLELDNFERELLSNLLLLSQRYMNNQKLAVKTEFYERTYNEMVLFLDQLFDSL